MSVFLSFVKKLSIYWRRVCFIGPLMSICHATKSKRDNMHREAETVELRVGKNLESATIYSHFIAFIHCIFCCCLECTGFVPVRVHSYCLSTFSASSFCCLSVWPGWVILFFNLMTLDHPFLFLLNMILV